MNWQVQKTLYIKNRIFTDKLWNRIWHFVNKHGDRGGVVKFRSKRMAKCFMNWCRIKELNEEGS